MQITSITVENFRSFGKAQTIPLGKLTLLVGPNNAGKSNALEALNAVRKYINSPNSMRVEIAEYLRSKTAVFAVGIGFISAKKVGNSNIRVGADSWSEEFAHSDNFSVSNGALTGAGFRGIGIGGESGLHWIQQHWPVGEIVSFLNAYEIRRAVPSQIDAASNVLPIQIVGPQGQNAAAVLDHLRDSHPDRYAAIQDDLRRCAPEFDRIVAQASGSPGFKEIWFYEKSGAAFRSRQVSEGLKFLVFVLLILHSPNPPRIFALEEIEHGLHPRRLRDVIGFLRQLTNRPDGPQIILTTHSPYVLDQFRDTPQDVVIVERGEDRCTVCTSLAERLKTVHDKDAPLGEMWFQGLVGGVPPT